MVKMVPLTKCNTVTNYKGRVKMDPPNHFFNCIQGVSCCVQGVQPL